MKRELVPSPEILRPPVKVGIVNLEGERDPSLHEPVGVEVISAKLKEKMPGVTPWLYDTQPELAKTGVIDIGNLAAMICEQANDTATPFVLGLGVPIYSYEYMRSLLLRLELNPPKSPLTVVLGNAIPTYTNGELIRRDFPTVIIVRGEGEEVFASIVKDVAEGRTPESEYKHAFADLRQYTPADRRLTQGIIDQGGSIKIEASRGCDYGACTFCSRCDRSGKDYRTVPEDRVVAQMEELLHTYNLTRFELTDEEAFGDTEATRRLVSAVKGAELGRFVPFTASLRVEVFNALEQEGLLEQLQEIGLDKVFLGAEGGSDRYLRNIGKGQTVAEIRKALALARRRNVNIELGFITFSWKMDFAMLVENISFLSEEHDGVKNADYVSSLFNHLAVRAGTEDEINLRRYVNDRDIQGYDPDKEFSVNLSMYQNVPFMDPRVAAVYEDVMGFARKDARVYYALKSAVRAGSLPKDRQKNLNDIYILLKNIHLRKLRSSVGLENEDDIEDARRRLITTLGAFAQSESGGKSEVLSSLRREIELFFKQEGERRDAEQVQRGALAVCRNEQGHYLLVRPRNEEEWAFPGGNVNPGEKSVDAVRRETMEELRVSTVEVLAPLPTVTRRNHTDSTTGSRDRLDLQHYAVRISQDIDLARADGEIADAIWLPPEMIIPQEGPARLKLKPNVVAIVNSIQRGDENEVIDINEPPEPVVTVRRRDRGLGAARRVLFSGSGSGFEIPLAPVSPHELQTDHPQT